MHRIAAGITATVLMAIASLGMNAPGTAHAQSTENIEVGNLYYCSLAFQDGICETNIIVGDTVVWNDVGGLHTVTQCNADFSVCPPAGGFDSGVIGVGTSFSQTFDTPGAFSYWCSIHPAQMRGRIVVQEPTPTPSPTPAPTPIPTQALDGGTVSPTPTATSSPAAVPQTGSAGSSGSPSSVAIAVAGMIAATLGAAVALRLSSTPR